MRTSRHTGMARVGLARLGAALLLVATVAMGTVVSGAPAQATPGTTTVTTTVPVIALQAQNSKDWASSFHQNASVDLVIISELQGTQLTFLSAYIHGRVHTWSTSKLLGFGSTVQVEIVPGESGPWPASWPSDQYRYGVDGTWIGNSDRRDEFQQDVPLAVATGASRPNSAMHVTIS